MATAQQANELKAQGAIEAAQDPNSGISAQAAQNVAVNEAKKAGSIAYQFDPNASVEEKREAARSKIPPGFHHERNPNAAALVSDTDTSAPKYDLPPPAKASAVAEENQIAEKAKGNARELDEDARWARVGWKPRFGMPGSDEEPDETSLLDHQTWLEGKLEEKFYGDWYHNTAVIIFACLSSWVVAVLGGGLGWVFCIMAACGTYYRTSIRRVRRNARDDVMREMAKTRLETDSETLEWINSFLVKFWPIYAPVLCDSIVASVDQVLSTSTPNFLEGLRMKTFVLGTKPPRLEHVKTYPKTEEDVVLMDWKFSFTPNDTMDLTARQLKNKVNPKIVLEIRVGKGVVSKGLDVIVEDMAFSGLMRLKFKLQIPFPHIEKVEMSFLERPTIDYVCKPLGGDTFGFDINFIPGLEGFIQEQIHANIGPMMYAPNVFPIEIAKMLAGTPVDQAIGVLQVTFHGAQGLKNPDKFSGTPDPYATVSINNRAVLARTKTVHENANPRWNETINVIITSLKDSLTVNIFDYNDIRKDKELGTATFSLEQLEEDDEHENLHLEVVSGGRPRGILQADVRFFPVLEGAVVDGVQEPPPESRTGICKFTVEQAKDLDGSKSLIGQLSPYAVLLLNGREIQKSKILKRTNNPIWPDATKELLITDRKKAKLGLVIKDDRDLATDPIIGTYQIGLDDMLELANKGQEWFNLAGVKTGRVKMKAQWKPVALKGAIAGSGGYLTPIGVMRLHFKGARDLKNLEAMGKSDPYARVLLSGIQKARTVTFKNNLNPEWDEVVYVPMHSTREKLTLEVMDEESLGKDRPLGHIELSAADYIKKDDNDEYAIYEEKNMRSESLRLNASKQPKGTLLYTCSFYPIHSVWDPDEDDETESQADSLSRTNSVQANGSNGNNSNHRKTISNAGTISSLRHSQSRDSAADSDTLKQLEQNEAAQEETAGPTKKVEKLRLTPDDLQKYESGLIVFKLLEGEFADTGAYLDIIMDDMAFPSHTTAKIRSRKMNFNEVGDAMVRELDFSKITIRIIEHVDKKGENDEDHVIAKLTGNTLDTLRRCLYQPTQLTLRDNHGRENKITVSCKYLPVKMTLHPSESFNNQGTLRVDVLDAADLPAADRNGYSDPYCKFILHGKEVYKTKTQKKTLHPAWNEFFEVQVRSRTAAEFEVKVYDWDFGDKSDFLGKAAINLNVLEPFQSQEVTLGLDGKSGAIRLKMLFKPDYVVRSRQGSSTFSGTFAVPGKVIGAPVKGVGKGAVLVGGGVIRAGTFLGRGFRRRKSRGERSDDDVQDLPPQQQSQSTEDTPVISIEEPQNDTAASSHKADNGHSRAKSWGAASFASAFAGGPGGSGSGEQGTAHLTIVSANGYPAGTNVRVHVRLDSSKGGKEVYKTKHIKSPSGSVVFDNETCKVPCTADAAFRLIVKDHATFGSDDELGEAQFFVDDQGLGGEKQVNVGSGVVVVRSSFEVRETGRAGSVISKEPKSPNSRKGLLSRGRDRDRESRSVTPA